jgi:uridine kinase
MKIRVAIDGTHCTGKTTVRIRVENARGGKIC